MSIAFPSDKIKTVLLITTSQVFEDSPKVGLLDKSPYFLNKIITANDLSFYISVFIHYLNLLFLVLTFYCIFLPIPLDFSSLRFLKEHFFLFHTQAPTEERAPWMGVDGHFAFLSSTKNPYVL